MTQEGMDNMVQEEEEVEEVEDNVPGYIRMSKAEIYNLFRMKCGGNDIVLDLDSYDTNNLRGFLMDVEERATLVKDRIVDVSLLHNVDDDEMISGIFIQIGGVKIELCISANKLYMHGFKVGGITYEAIENHRRLPGSEDLGFGVSYQDFEMDPKSFKLGWHSIRKAAHIFRKHSLNFEPINHANLKSAFSVTIVMILESLRFHEVRREVLQCYENKNDRIWVELRKIVKDWKKSYQNYYMWRRAKQESDFYDGENISTNNQFIIDHFPTVISATGLAASPLPPPLSEDELNDYAYDKKVTNTLRKLMIGLQV